MGLALSQGTTDYILVVIQNLDNYRFLAITIGEIER